MAKTAIFTAVAIVAAITLIAVLYLLTSDQTTGEACFDSQRDIGAAVLADREDDQDALVNRAIIVRGNCDQDE